jgi:hypothetical protein
MAKPIPVFAFAFAAFAATLSRRPRASSEEADGADPIDLFMTIWRMPSCDRANITVKVGILGADGGDPPRLFDRGSPRPHKVEDLWLHAITETALGFSGIVRSAPQRLKIRRGQKIDFALKHILGWTLGVDASAPKSAESSPVALVRNARDGLADSEFH